MNKKLLLILFTILFSTSTFADEISLFRSVITINNDKSVNIEETMNVNNVKQKIFQNAFVRFFFNNEGEFEKQHKHYQASLNGRKLPHETGDHANLKIFVFKHIGLKKGENTFQIKYKRNNMINPSKKFKNHFNFTYLINEPHWNVTTKQVSAEVIIPGKYKDKEIIRQGIIVNPKSKQKSDPKMVKSRVMYKGEDTKVILYTTKPINLHDRFYVTVSYLDPDKRPKKGKIVTVPKAES